MEISESIELDSELDRDGEMCITIYGIEGYIDKDIAKKIVLHLTKVFDLEEE